MNKRFLILLGVALLLAFFAAKLVNNLLIKSRESQQSQIKTVPVVTAAVDIPYGVKLDETQLTLIDWPSASVPPGTFSAKEQVVNRPTIIIPENHYVLMYDRNPAVNPARIHLLTDIKDTYKRKDIFPYIGPNPPVNSGIHNYIFILCKGVPPYSPSDRNGFNPTPFYNNIIAMNYFFIDTIK